MRACIFCRQPADPGMPPSPGSTCWCQHKERHLHGGRLQHLTNSLPYNSGERPHDYCLTGKESPQLPITGVDPGPHQLAANVLKKLQQILQPAACVVARRQLCRRERPPGPTPHARIASKHPGMLPLLHPQRTGSLAPHQVSAPSPPSEHPSPVAGLQKQSVQQEEGQVAAAAVANSRQEGGNSYVSHTWGIAMKLVQLREVLHRAMSAEG